MTRRNLIDGFPPEVRRMIQNRLYERGFQGYVGLVEELASEGYCVSKSGLHRFSRSLEARVKQAELDSLMQQHAAGNAGNGQPGCGVQLDLLDAIEGSER